MAKGRSPNYPSLNIKEAVERVRKIFSTEHMHQAPKQSVAEALGYTGLNGKSLTVIGSLRRYGLLEAAGDGLRVTKDAVTLIELGPSEQAYRETLNRLVFTPGLFSELRDELGSTLPSESTLRHNLINKGFMSKAADEVIRVYRENIEIVASEGGEYSRQIGDELTQNNNAQRLSLLTSATGPSGQTGPTGPTAGWISATSKMFPPTARGEVAGSNAMNNAAFSLEEGDANIQWPKVLSAESYAQFLQWLELVKSRAKPKDAAKTAQDTDKSESQSTGNVS